ncbi:hypothetical protein, partial [Staphylococcus aureus]|uniref:hypothetical protein n=1 Tax=Staphylococcus aureus TaxID=1280 RepID=UPI00244C7680
DGQSLTPAAGWRWEDAPMPPRIDAAGLVDHLSQTGRIVELDAVRHGDAPRDAAAVPGALLDALDLWL